MWRLLDLTIFLDDNYIYYIFIYLNDNYISYYIFSWLYIPYYTIYYIICQNMTRKTQTAKELWWATIFLNVFTFIKQDHLDFKRIIAYESTNPWPIFKLGWGMLVDSQSLQLSLWRTQKTCHRPSDVRHWSIDHGILKTHHPSTASRRLELNRDLWSNRI